MLFDLISFPRANSPFDSTARYLLGNKKWLACTPALFHHPEIHSLEKLPPQIFDGHDQLSFLLQMYKHTPGCVDLRKTDQAICREHSRWRCCTLLNRFPRNDYITKVDLPDCYLHFHRFMQLMREAK